MSQNISSRVRGIANKHDQGASGGKFSESVSRNFQALLHEMLGDNCKHQDISAEDLDTGPN